MAVDLGSLLKKPAGLAKKPPVLPAGNYPGIVKSYEIDNKNKNNTPYVRFQIGLVGWAEDCPDSWEVADTANPGKTYTVSKADVDLSKRQMRRDFFFTDDALWRLDEFIRSCNVEPNGRQYDEIVPELVGVNIVAAVEQYLNQNTSEIGNQIGKLAGAE